MARRTISEKVKVRNIIPIYQADVPKVPILAPRKNQIVCFYCILINFRPADKFKFYLSFMSFGNPIQCHHLAIVATKGGKDLDFFVHTISVIKSVNQTNKFLVCGCKDMADFYYFQICFNFYSIFWLWTIVSIQVCHFFVRMNL